MGNGLCRDALQRISTYTNPTNNITKNGLPWSKTTYLSIICILLPKCQGSKHPDFIFLICHSDCNGGIPWHTKSLMSFLYKRLFNINQIIKESHLPRCTAVGIKKLFNQNQSTQSILYINLDKSSLEICFNASIIFAHFFVPISKCQVSFIYRTNPAIFIQNSKTSVHSVPLSRP